MTTEEQKKLYESEPDSILVIADEQGKEEFTCTEFEISYTCKKGRKHSIKQGLLDGYVFDISILNVYEDKE